MRKQREIPPAFTGQAQERCFREEHDVTDCVDWSGTQRAVDLKPTTQTVSLRLPRQLLDSIKSAAHSRDLPCRSLINVWLQKQLPGL